MQSGPRSGLVNNSPTAEQFSAAYKRLLLRSSIQGHNGNCTKQNETDILEVIGDTYKAKSSTDSAIIRKYDLQGTNQIQDDDDDYQMVTKQLVQDNTEVNLLF